MRSTTPGSLKLLPVLAAIGAAYGLATAPAFASSHREAPSITATPKVDATDFYMFRSYETGRAGFVTLIANYQPLQNPGDGPNYYKMDPNALYEIHIDNVGDAKEHITFQFRFQNKFNATALSIGGTSVAIPLTQSGSVTGLNDQNLNVNETYTVTMVTGDRRTGVAAPVTKVGGSATFEKPVDNIGTKTIPNYAAYAALHVFPIQIPNCSTAGKVFVGQRKDPFAVNLGTIFDLVNAPASFVLDPTQKDAATDSLANKNVTTIALEVPASCLVNASGTDPVIGGWTTASLRQGSLQSAAPKSGYQTAAISGGAWTQVSRLSMPLVNEVVIGLPDKDKFNGSKPMNDAQFATYVTNPTLPTLISTVLSGGATLAPTNYPRTDLVTTFLTGIKGINQQATVTASEMLRLNTSIAAVPLASQNRLGIVGNILANGTDNAGYPNGRRPNDDVVDISLVAVMGGLCVANGTANTYGFGTACNPSAVSPTLTAVGTNGLPSVFNLHDGVDQGSTARQATLLSTFPYIGTPLAGAM